VALYNVSAGGKQIQVRVFGAFTILAAFGMFGCQRFVLGEYETSALRPISQYKGLSIRYSWAANQPKETLLIVVIAPSQFTEGRKIISGNNHAATLVKILAREVFCGHWSMFSALSHGYLT